MSAVPATGSFFPPVRPGPTLEELDGDAGHRLPPWAGPPEDVRPGAAALSVLLGRSGTTAVLLEGARTYPTGLVLRLVVGAATAAARPAGGCSPSST